MSPHSVSWEEGYDITTGTAGASLMFPPPTKAELAAYRKELREKDAKRKPIGFAAWPKDTEKVTGGAESAPKPQRAARQVKTQPKVRQR